MAEERLQKILARAGFGSRRASEEYIIAGRVRVNGEIAELGSKADPEKDRILVDGQPITLPDEPVYIALYKPRNVISAVSGPDPRPTVRDLVDLPGQLYPVGRLDVDSEGLILLTNDGDLANRLTHPRYGHEKEYRVLVARRPDEQQLENWRRGIVMEDGYHTAPAEVRFESTFGKGAWLRVIMREGRKRQIRETGQLLGLPVVRILRVRIGTLVLGSMKPREWRRLTAEEIQELKTGKRSSTQKAGSSAPRQRKAGGAPPGNRAHGPAAGRSSGKRTSSSDRRTKESGRSAPSRPSSRPVRPGARSGGPSDSESGQRSSRPSRARSGGSAGEPSGTETGQRSGRPSRQRSGGPSGSESGQRAGRPPRQRSGGPAGDASGPETGQRSSQPPRQRSGSGRPGSKPPSSRPPSRRPPARGGTNKRSGARRGDGRRGGSRSKE